MTRRQASSIELWEVRRFKRRRKWSFVLGLRNRSREVGAMIEYLRAGSEQCLDLAPPLRVKLGGTPPPRLHPIQTAEWGAGKKQVTPAASELSSTNATLQVTWR